MHPAKGQGVFAELPEVPRPRSAGPGPSTPTDEQHLRSDVLANLKGRVEPSAFDTRAQDASAVAIDDRVVIVSTPNGSPEKPLMGTRMIGAVLARVTLHGNGRFLNLYYADNH